MNSSDSDDLMDAFIIDESKDILNLQGKYGKKNFDTRLIRRF